MLHSPFCILLISNVLLSFGQAQGCYLSSHDLWEVLGIGAASQLDELEIRWPAPSKRVDKFANVAPNRYVHIIEGKGML